MQAKTTVHTFYKIKPLYYLAPKAVFPDSTLKPLTTGVHALPGGVNATLLLKSEVEALAKYIEEHDPTGIMLKEALKAERRRKQRTGTDAIGEATRLLEREMSPPPLLNRRRRRLSDSESSS
jgi:hypothetical protein